MDDLNQQLFDDLSVYLKKYQLKDNFAEIAAWVDEKLFENNFIKQNLALNLLWIFSQARILPHDRVVMGVCSWLFIMLRDNLQHDELFILSALQTVALERLTAHTKRLPQISTCLTNTERDEVLATLHSAVMDDRVLSFGASGQFSQLQKLESIPIVNSFLDNYEILLDLATGEDADGGSIGSILQYIMKVNDVVKDSTGVLGLVDDLYALEQLKRKIDTSKVSDIKWLFETTFPDFQYPIMIDSKGNNLIHKVDDLIKASIIYSDHHDLNRKLFFLEEPGPFAMLSSMLGMIIDLKLDTEISYVKNRDRLVIGKKYKFSKGSQFAVLEFGGTHEHGSQVIYMFSPIDSGRRMLKSSIIEGSVIHETEEELSRDYQLDNYLNSYKRKIYGMFPFGLANNLNISFHSNLLVDRKKNIDYYMKTNIEGYTIEEWFGCRRINTLGKIEETIGLLSDEPLITVTYSIKSLVGYLLKQRPAPSTFHSANIVISKSIDNEAEELNILSGSYGDAFKTINFFATERSEYFESYFENLNYRIFSEKRSLEVPFINPPNNSLFENYLSKVGAYPEIEFISNNEPLLEEFYELFNFKLPPGSPKLQNLLFSVKRIFLSRYSPLTSKVKIALATKVETFVSRLKSYVHINPNISLIIDFLQCNQTLLSDYQKFDLATSMQALDQRNNVLLSIKQLTDLAKKHPTDNHISPNELLELNQLDTLIVPAYINRRQTRALINFPFAEKIMFIASDYEIAHYLQPLVAERDGIMENSTSEENEPREILPFEKEFLVLNFDGFGSRAASSDVEAHEAVDSKVFIFEDDQYYAVPRGGKLIITYDDVNLHPIEVAAADIEPGDCLILPDTNGGDLQDSIMDLSVKNIKEVRTKAFMWKTELLSSLNANALSLEDLERQLAQSGESRKLSTIKNWFKNPHLIAPQHPEKVFYVFASILGKDKNYFDESLLQISALYKARNKVMKDLPKYLKNGRYDEASNMLKMNINGKIFHARLYEVLGSEDSKISFESLYKIKEMDELA